MVVYTFIHKETKEIIKCHYMMIDDEFGRVYYFTPDHGALWFVDDINRIEFIIENKKFIHPQYSMMYYSPSVEDINLDDYEVKKFVIDNDFFKEV